MRISDWSSDVCSSDWRSPSRPTLARKSSCDPGITPVPWPAPGSVPVPSGAGGSVSGAFFAQAPTASMVIAAIIAVLFRIVMFSVLLLLLGNHSAGKKNRLDALFEQDRQSVVWGKSVSVRVDLGGGRIIKKKK